MPAIVVFLLGVSLAAVAALARLRLALAVTVGTLVLVPGSLLIPNGLSSYPTVIRAVSVALLFNVVVGVWTGRYDAGALRPRRIHALLGLLVGVAIVNGIALGIPGVSTGAAFPSFVLVLDQVVFFVAVLAAVRLVDDPSFVMWLVGGFVVAAALVGMWEWFTENSWAGFFFDDLQAQRANQLVEGLETRAGDVVRVRGAATFALEFGWLLAMAFPLVVVAASRARPLVAIAAPAVVALAVYWSNARSAVVALAVGAVLVLLLSRVDWRVGRLVLVGGIAALALVTTIEDVERPFTVAQQSGSVDVRVERLRVATDIAADHAYTGLGFQGLEHFEITTTDTSFVLAYADLGVIGLAVFVVTLLGGVASTFGGLRAPPGRERGLAAAAAAGAILAIGATGAYDLFSLPASLRFVWLFVAVGMWLGERNPPEIEREARPRVGVRVLAPVAGLVIGVAIAGLVPSPSASTFRFDAVPADTMSLYRGETVGFFGRIHAETACTVIEGIDREHSDADITCRPIPQAVDVGRIRIEADDADTVREVAAALDGRVSRNQPGFELHAEDPGPVSATPTWARTAPVWLTLVAALLAGLVPVMPYRRALVWRTDTSLDEAVGIRPSFSIGRRRDP